MGSVSITFSGFRSVEGGMSEGSGWLGDWGQSKVQEGDRAAASHSGPPCCAGPAQPLSHPPTPETPLHAPRTRVDDAAAVVQEVERLQRVARQVAHHLQRHAPEVVLPAGVVGGCEGWVGGCTLGSGPASDADDAATGCGRRQAAAAEQGPSFTHTR